MPPSGASALGARASAIALLACPNCGASLRSAGGSLLCPSGHRFDVARGGHVTLLTGSTGPGGDDAAMVEARARFLEAGHYDAITAAITSAAERALDPDVPGGVADLGAGTGQLLARVLDRQPERPGVAVDLSRPAARRAAHAHSRGIAVVCDLWRAIPVRTGAIALALNVFAPRNGAEIRRILHPRGALVVSWPERGHLRELVDALGLLSVDPRKDERVEAALRPDLVEQQRTTIERTLTLPHRAVAQLVAMGPSARHLEPDLLHERIARLPDPVAVRLTAVVAVFRPSSDGRPVAGAGEVPRRGPRRPGGPGWLGA